MTRPRSLFVAILLITSFPIAAPCLAVSNIATNPGFEDLDLVGGPGDSWSAFGAASYDAFFGANAHASLFGDDSLNVGGVYQTGLPAVAGQAYQFDLLNTRIESNWDADLRLGLEFYAPDDTTKIGESKVLLNTAERLALPNVDGGGAANGAVFSVQGTAPVGATIVRPILEFDNVNPLYFFEPQANVFAFDSFLSEVPLAGGNLLKNPGFGDNVNLSGALGQVWGSFGNIGFNDFFAGNIHASIFADTAGNSGGFFQQSILGDENKTYQFDLSDVRIEANFDADIQFGLEYYGSDDFNKLGEDLANVDTSTTGDGLSFSMSASPVAGTQFIRPVVLFDNVNAAYLGESQANAFIFDTNLQEVTKVPGDTDGDGDVDLLDLDALGANFGTLSGATCAEGDFDGDGDVDLLDLDILGANFGTTPSASVPEPNAIMIALFGAAAILRSRRS